MPVPPEVRGIPLVHHDFIWVNGHNIKIDLYKYKGIFFNIPSQSF